ncbi:MAG: PilT/PilU family type 4a pilus ATPase [Planctomycetaceae bacterium]|nr:MAG: PilT/PilU family type 4a pilus ATPase [Planctomycetaceae bacterium]
MGRMESALRSLPRRRTQPFSSLGRTARCFLGRTVRCERSGCERPDCPVGRQTEIVMNPAGPPDPIPADTAPVPTQPNRSDGDNRLPEWLLEATRCGASDLHVVAGYPPVLRVHGQLRELPGGPLESESLRRWLLQWLPLPAHERFLTERNADFAMELDREGTRQRYRANYFFAADQIGGCFRVIPDQIPDFDWAGFPFELAERLVAFRNGLILFCGVTGAGKTTSLAMIINLLCQRSGCRVVTIEEPIEYRFPHYPGSVVSQREVGTDVRSFDEGLKFALRQDPDAILVGEIRDRETAQTALRAAETGHLVFSTMHTRDAKGAISRYTDLFDQDSQQEIRSQLASGLRAVISQHLLRSFADDLKRVLALETLFNTSQVAISIRNGKLESIDNTIQTGRAEGMLPLSESVRRHFQSGLIDRETAERFVQDRSYLR